MLPVSTLVHEKDGVCASASPPMKADASTSGAKTEELRTAFIDLPHS
jgi:hypothetical protein